MLKFSVISPDATYQLNTSVSPVNEGQSSMITLTTTGVQEGQTIPYTISGVGITSADISGEPLTGNFVVSGGVATKTLNIANDLTTEGQETLTMSLGNGTNVSLTINDTSLTPAAGDPYYDNVTLLMHMDNSILDTKGHIVKTEGVPAVSSSVTKFGTSSYACSATAGVYFDGDKDWDLSTGDFTVEFFVYPTSAPNYSHIIGTANPWYGGGWSGGSGVTGGGGWGLNGDANNILFVGSGRTQAMYPFTWTLNQWHHVAWVRKNGTYSLYQNGVLKSASVTGTVISDITNRLYVGRHTNYPSNNFPGYIDELRITKGVARYTSNFTVPPAAFPDIENENVDPFWNNVVLGMHMDGTNGSTTFVDETGMVPTRSGLSVISTAQSKFGSSSLLLSDVNDGLIFPTTNAVAFGTGDFTVEMWVRPTNLTVNSSNGYMLLETRPPSTTGNYLTVWISNIGLFSMYDGTTTSTATTTFQINTWYHCAVVRKNGQLSLYVNGQQEASVASNVDFLASNILIGLNAFRATAPATNFYGYIDDLRITKGVGRYVTDFVPPTRSFAEMA